MINVLPASVLSRESCPILSKFRHFILNPTVPGRQWRLSGPYGYSPSSPASSSPPSTFPRPPPLLLAPRFFADLLHPLPCPRAQHALCPLRRRDPARSAPCYSVACGCSDCASASRPPAALLIRSSALDLRADPTWDETVEEAHVAAEDEGGGRGGSPRAHPGGSKKIREKNDAPIPKRIFREAVAAEADASWVRVPLSALGVRARRHLCAAIASSRAFAAKSCHGGGGGDSNVVGPETMDADEAAAARTALIAPAAPTPSELSLPPAGGSAEPHTNEHAPCDHERLLCHQRSLYSARIASFVAHRQTQPYAREGKGDIYLVASVLNSDICDFRRHRITGAALLEKVAFKGGHTKRMARRQREYGKCEGRRTLIWICRYTVKRRYYCERLFHLRLFERGGVRDVYKCTCKVAHREFLTFPSIGGLAQGHATMKSVLRAMGEQIRRTFFSPSFATKDIYQLILQS
ncbi:hypothetical protein B0H11DRAFT_1937642 [Mycena galericulata]|nr:hypothetical protein B0H11DRAFT_1937642 [Mycena galericulata]